MLRNIRIVQKEFFPSMYFITRKEPGADILILAKRNGGKNQGSVRFKCWGRWDPCCRWAHRLGINTRERMLRPKADDGASVSALLLSVRRQLSLSLSFLLREMRWLKA